MKPIRTGHLSAAQQAQIRELLDKCSTHDACPAFFPEADVRQYYLYPSSDGTLDSIFAACQSPDFDDELECVAYTAPSMRRKGYFSALLELCIQDFSETDLVFPVNHRSTAALRTMAALQAECMSTEYRMDYELGNALNSGAVELQEQETYPSLSLITADNHLWQLTSSTIPVARCKTAVSGAGVCLYEVETAPSFRNQGFAAAMLALLFPRLKHQGADYIFLHVSGSNEAAIALYQKTGFRITETLSYYLY